MNRGRVGSLLLSLPLVVGVGAFAHAYRSTGGRVVPTRALKGLSSVRLSPVGPRRLTAGRLPVDPSVPVTNPNHKLTPGVVLTTDLRRLKEPGYSRSVRHVTKAEKIVIAKAYGFTGDWKTVEFDHLIPLSVGGSNDPSNLWPQPIAEAKIKDGFEDWLYHAMMENKLPMPLPEMQRRIGSDWVGVWNSLGRPSVQGAPHGHELL